MHTHRCCARNEARSEMWCVRVRVRVCDALRPHHSLLCSRTAHNTFHYYINRAFLVCAQLCEIARPICEQFSIIECSIFLLFMLIFSNSLFVLLVHKCEIISHNTCTKTQYLLCFISSHSTYNTCLMCFLLLRVPFRCNVLMRTTNTNPFQVNYPFRFVSFLVTCRAKFIKWLRLCYRRNYR